MNNQKKMTKNNSIHVLYYCIIFLPSLFQCCHNHKDTVSDVSFSTKDTIEAIEKAYRLNLMDSIDSYDIKMSLYGYTTTTFERVSEIRQRDCLIPSDSGYFGCYTFLSKNPKKGMMQLDGYMVIWNKQRPWTYSSKNDLLIELRIFTDKIKLWNGLSIGMSRDVLISLLGKPVLNKVGRLFFKVGDGQYLDAIIDEQNIVYALQLFRSEKDFSNSTALQEHVYDFYEPQ